MKTFHRTARLTGIVVALASSIALSSGRIVAQTGFSSTSTTATNAPAMEAVLALPDEPGLRASSGVPAALLFAKSDSAPAKVDNPAAGATLPEASRTDKIIQPGQAVPSLTAGDKALLGLKDAFSPFSIIAWFTTAGYSHLTDSSPQYGTDRGAFGQRLGASAIRDVTEGILCDSVMSPIFHEDPRYYRLGKTHNFFARVVYSGTRPVIARTDGGHHTLNFANIAGSIGGSALSNLYYPEKNRSAQQTFETFGGSLLGDAIGDLVTEFYRDFTAIFRSEHKPDRK